ncbi:MAG: nucleotidyltransferase domain-containing protein [Bdellovibrionales bacterium]
MSALFDLSDQPSVQKLVNWIDANYPFVQKIWLFGSRARGDHFDRSDIDIALEVSDNARWLHVMADIDEDAPTLLEIDCVDYAKVSGDFKDNIDKEKVLIYERGAA